MALVRLRRECTEAKEALSTDSEASIPVLLPGGQSQIRLVRSEFEAMIDDGVQQTIVALKRAMQAADTDAEDLSAILLIGGSSRIPLVAQLLSAEFNRPIAIDADPKASISLGAAPGCETLTLTAGKSMSGLLLTCMFMNDTRPASSSPMKSTIGGTGLRMHQDEMLRKFIEL